MAFLSCKIFKKQLEKRPVKVQIKTQLHHRSIISTHNVFLRSQPSTYVHICMRKKGVISNSKRLKNLVSGRDEGSHDAKQFARLVIRYSLPFIVFIKSISAVLINMHNDMNRQAQPNPLFRSACKKYQNYEHPLYIFNTRTDLKEKYLDDFEI